MSLVVSVCVLVFAAGLLYFTSSTKRILCQLLTM